MPNGKHSGPRELEPVHQTIPARHTNCIQSSIHRKYMNEQSGAIHYNSFITAKGCGDET